MRELGSRDGTDRQASSPVPGGPTSEAQDSRFQGHFFKKSGCGGSWLHTILIEHRDDRVG